MKPEEIAAINDAHTERHDSKGPYCDACEGDWPCSAHRLIKHIDDLETIIARLSSIPRGKHDR